MSGSAMVNVHGNREETREIKEKSGDDADGRHFLALPLPVAIAHRPTARAAAGEGKFSTLQ